MSNSSKLTFITFLNFSAVLLCAEFMHIENNFLNNA